MPYRRAAVREALSCAQLCSGCGHTLRSGRAATTVSCSVCGLEQPAAREGPLGPPASILCTSSEPARYSELVPYGETFGSSEQCSQLTLLCDGVTLHVTLSINSSTVQGVDLDAQSGPFPTVRFQLETAADQEAKLTGLAREAQTGDRDFDEEVYIDTEVSDEDVRVILASSSVRAAIRRLLDDHKTVQLGPSGVVAKNSRDRSACFEPARLAAGVAALRVLAGARRPVAAEITPRPLRSRVTLAVAALSPPLGLFGAIVGLLSFPLLEASFVLLPLFGGALAGLLVQVFLPALVRGRSSSRRDLTLVRVLVFCACVVSALALCSLANGWLDRSPERVETLVVTNTWFDSEHDISRVDARPAIDSPEKIELSFDDPGKAVKVGQRVTMWTRAGALGGRWHSRPAVVDADGKLIQQD